MIFFNLKKTIAVILFLAIVNFPVVCHGIAEPCECSAEELVSAIKEIAPQDEMLSQYAEDFLETECPIVLISISALESGWGRSDLARVNLFGVKHKNQYVRFEDKNGCHPEWTIGYTEWVLKTRFKGCETIAQIGRTYSGKPEEWTKGVQNIHDRLWEILEENDGK